MMGNLRARKARRGVLAVIIVGLGVAAACTDLGGFNNGGPEAPEAGSPEGSANADAADACPPGFGDCDGDPANGCETRVADNASHCGFCGNVCAAGANGYPVCVDGACRIGCNTGFDNCDTNDANGCEKDVTADPSNCGACGHACGGPCASSLCTPTRVLDQLDRPSSLVVGRPLNPGGTPQQIYFQARSGSVVALFRTAVTGAGGATEITGTKEVSLPRLFLDGDRVFFAIKTDLAWCEEPCTDIPSRPVYRRALPQIAGDFSMNDPSLALVVAFSPPGLGGGAVHSFDKSASALLSSDAAVPLTQVASVGPLAMSLTQDTANVYVGVGLQGGTDTGVYRASRDGGASQTAALVVDASVGQGGLTTGGDRLFFVTTDSSLYGCVASNCPSTLKVYGKVSGGSGVATDTQFVYWAEPGTTAGAFQDGRILRCPLSGCVGAPTVFAVGQLRPSGVTLRDSDVYWSVEGNQTPGAGALYKLAK